jgi:hypothetical protein
MHFKDIFKRTNKKGWSIYLFFKPAAVNSALKDKQISISPNLFRNLFLELFCRYSKIKYYQTSMQDISQPLEMETHFFAPGFQNQE